MLDRLTSLRVFATAVERGAISAAARALGMSPTMATRHIDALEARLACQLLIRTTRALILTEEGARYLEFARRMVAEFDEGEAAFLDRGRVPAGGLRMSAPVALGVRRIAPLMADFAARFPGIEVELDLADRRVDLTAEGYDLAIRVGEAGPGALRQRRIGTAQGALVAAPAYLAAHGRPQRIADLAHHVCLGYTLSSLTGRHRWQLGRGRKGAVAVSTPLLSNNGEALAAAAIAGLGITLQPDFIVGEAIAEGRLEALRLADLDALPLGPILAVWPERRETPPRVRAMVEFLAERWKAAALP